VFAAAKVANPLIDRSVPYVGDAALRWLATMATEYGAFRHLVSRLGMIGLCWSQ